MSSSNASSREQLDSIETELLEVEHGLEVTRPRAGRASFNSVSSILGDIRSRLDLVEASDDPNGRGSRLSERLETAELAHSQRIPLGLLRGSNATLQRARQSARASMNLSRSSIADVQAKCENEQAEKTTEDRKEEEKEPDRRSQYARSRRRSSVLVASRVRADQAQGFEVELDLHDGGAGLLSPVQEQSTQEIEIDSEESTKMAATEAPEIPVLLSKRQRLLGSSGNLSGSVHPPSASGFIVYSWGSGVQSLHDDANDRNVLDAKLSPDSRIGRPGASAVLSVSTSQGHTACASAQGEVLLCGLNREGAVDPDRRDEEVIKRPAILESLGQTRVLQVSCGLDHTAALSANGSVLTWGSNKEGQLGHARPFRKDADVPVTFCRPKIMQLGSGRRAAAVACGHKFTLVLTTRMSVLACGTTLISGYQQDEDGTPRLPTTLPALDGLPLISVAAGSDHAIVLTSHGTAFAWGVNKNGCCGRPFPETLAVPVPVHVPKSEYTLPSDDKSPFENWANWDDGEMSVAADVAVVHAACGDGHTVLVTQSGRLLVCGSNEHGQLGLAPASSVCPLRSVNHPEHKSGRRFVSAEGGQGHTLILDNIGDVWQMGSDSSCTGASSGAESEKSGGPKRVIAGQTVLTIAAGGRESIAIGAGGGSIRRQFSLSPDCIGIDSDAFAESLEDVLEQVSTDEGGMDMDADAESPEAEASSSGHELAKRTKELLRYPEVLNSLFLHPDELDRMFGHLMAVSNAQDRQAITTAIEQGIKLGLEKLRSGDARMMYPEAVRCLLLYIEVFGHVEESDTVFDLHGEVISLLCEAILALPFEGYKAWLTWATTLYSGDRFLRLVRPLLGQIKKGLKVDVDNNGVMHTQLSRRSVPLVVAVLRWLYKASERMGDIVPPQEFYCEAISKIPAENLYDDLDRYKKANKHEKSTHFFLCANPFLVPLHTKSDLVLIENQVEMMKIATRGVTYNEDTEEFTIDPFFVLEIEREHMLEQTLEKIKKTDATELRKKLRVVFKGEEGVDAGGVTKEFFQLLSEDLFDTHSSLWSNRFGDEITWFNSDCTWDEEGFELVGVLVGLAVYNGVLLDVRFPMAVYRKILGLPLGLEDMVDAVVKRSLQQLLDYEGDDVEDIFCLSFEVSWMDLGKEQKIELKPGGADIPVTSDNKEEYVLLYVKWLLVDSIQPQWEAFDKGLMRIMQNSTCFDLFRQEELKLLVVGSPELDFDALEAKAEYEGGYDKDSDVVRNFWRFVKSASRETQLQLLKFATGSSMAPIGGLGELKFKIQRAGPDSPQLPTSHTCFNTLLLPDYGADYDRLEERLGRAILECEGFGLQ